MSLRKAPQLTPELLAASRRNARHSTGPLSAAANMLLRQEGALDRSIDRKVRILLRLRKESPNRSRWSGRSLHDREHRGGHIQRHYVLYIAGSGNGRRRKTE